MSVFRSLLLSLFVAALPGFGITAPAAAADQPQGPLKVKISNYYGIPKIKVARKLRVTVSCNRDCAVRVKGSLRMPAGRVGWSASRGMSAGSIWFLTYKLTRFGVRYLRQNWRNSWYVIRVSAKDLETGKRTVRIRNFRFRLR